MVWRCQSCCYCWLLLLVCQLLPPPTPTHSTPSCPHPFPCTEVCSTDRPPAAQAAVPHAAGAGCLALRQRQRLPAVTGSPSGMLAVRQPS